MRKVFSSCEHTLFDVAEDMTSKRQEFKAAYTAVGHDFPQHADQLVVLARQVRTQGLTHDSRAGRCPTRPYAPF